MGKKVLVAYFSASGVTKKVAETIAEVTQGDIYEIKPKVPYTSADLDWRDKNSRSTVEMRDPNSRPAIANSVENFRDYDTIFVGFPIWWYVAPSIVNTFLESYDFTGKTIVPFATSGGSGFGETETKLKALLPSNVSWKSGKLLNGNVSKETVSTWISTLEL
jgi:flavodoxin